MEKEKHVICQECGLEITLTSENCPKCDSLIYADVSLYEYKSLKEELRKARDELKSLQLSSTSPQKMKLDLGFAALAVEVYNSDCPVPEIVVCLENNDGISIQDIAVIRQTVENEQPKEALECLVYSDELDENYTHKFSINRHKEHD